MARKAGIVLSDEDRDDLASGRRTIIDLAAKHECRKQTISYHVRKARSAGSTASAASASTPSMASSTPPEPSPAPATSDPDEPALTPDELGALAHEHIAGGFLAVVNQANALLAQNVGPSGLKAVTAVLGMAHDRLIALGVIRADAHQPSKMTIHVYNEAELAEIRRKADLPEDEAS